MFLTALWRAQSCSCVSKHCCVLIYTRTFDFSQAQKSVDISRSFLNKKHYTFDATYGASSHTSEIYEDMVHPLVRHVIDGYSAVFTLYGQSSTGKTYTSGSDASTINTGCILRACGALLAAFGNRSETTRNGDLNGGGQQCGGAMAQSAPANAHVFLSLAELFNGDFCFCFCLRSSVCLFLPKKGRYGFV